jgi:hypothetical protein
MDWREQYFVFWLIVLTNLMAFIIGLFCGVKL